MRSRRLLDTCIIYLASNQSGVERRSAKEASKLEELETITMWKRSMQCLVLGRTMNLANGTRKCNRLTFGKLKITSLF